MTKEIAPECLDRLQEPAQDPINPDLVKLLKSGGLYTMPVTGNDSLLLSNGGQGILDMVPGLGAAPLGHGPNSVTETVANVLQQDVPNLVQPVFPQLARMLASRLKGLAPMDVDRVYFATTGSESIEIALNTARLATDKLRVISTVNAYHGKSAGALSVTYTEEDNLFSQLSGTIFVPFGDSGAMAESLDAEGDTVAAVILEPIQGLGGVHVADPAYFQAARELCTQHGALLIFDETLTGIGRTGHLFATEWTGVAPDIILLGKALGGGVIPISACLLGHKARVKTLHFQHMSTHVGSLYSVSAANAMLEVLLNDNQSMLRHVSQLGNEIEQIHARLKFRFPDLIKDVRGMGLLHGIEFVPSTKIKSGGHGAVLALARAMDQLPQLIAGNMLSSGVRVAPAPNAKNVLMICPSYTLEASQLEHYETALTNCLEAIDQRDTPRVVKHLSGVADFVDVVPTGGEEAEVEPIGEIGEDEGRFAFILHWLEADDIQMLDPALRCLPRRAREELAEKLGDVGGPSVLSQVRVRGKDGSTAVGDFIAIPCSAAQLMSMDPSEAADRVQEAVELGVKRGAKIVGLGGFTSIVTRAGATIDPMGAALTTGNGFTIEAALMAADYGCTILGRDQTKITAAIVGAAGSIGSGLIQILVGRVNRLYLFVNPATPAQKSFGRLRRSLCVALKAYRANELVAKPGTLLDRCGPLLKDYGKVEDLAEVLLRDPDFFVISDDCKADSKKCEIVYSATNSTEKLIAPEDLSRSTMVCDLSRPGNISKRCRDERADVLLFDGGVISFPGRPELGLGYDMPKGVSFACVAETVMLSLKKHYKNTSVGASPSHAEIAMLRGIAAETGFTLADLRAFDRPLGRVEWSQLLPTDAQVTPETHGGAPARVSVPERAGSIAPQSMIDFYEVLITRRVQSVEVDDPALIERDGRSFTWSDLDQAARTSAFSLAQKGVREGSRVIVAGNADFVQFAAIAGLWLLGAVPVALDADLPKDRLHSALKLVDPVMAIGTEMLVRNFEEFMPVNVFKSATELMKTPESTVISKPRRASSEAVVIFTSGSTGVPKAVSHSYADLVNMAENYGNAFVEFSQRDRVIVTSKLCYSFGFSVSFVTLLHGAALLLADGKFNPEALLDQIESQHASILFTFPTIYNILLKKRMRSLVSLRLCVAAGEAKSHFIDDRWEKVSGVPIHNGFGTTEALSFVFATPKEESGGKNLGTVVPGFEVEIRRANGEIANVGEAGVAWIRGNTMAHEYIGAPKKTNAAFVDDWYCTNDILRMDEQARFHYLGRASDIVKVGGVWMSPNDTQNLIAAHPCVNECAVVLYEDPAPLVRPYAFVVPVDGQPGSDEFVEEIKDEVRAKLGRAQVPYKVFFSDALPRTGNGKVQRNTLTSMVEERMLETDARKGRSHDR